MRLEELKKQPQEFRIQGSALPLQSCIYLFDFKSKNFETFMDSSSSFFASLIMAETFKLALLTAPLDCSP